MRKILLSLSLVTAVSLFAVGYIYSSGVLPGSCKNPEKCYTCHHVGMPSQGCVNCHSYMAIDFGCDRGAFAEAGNLTTGRFIAEANLLDDNTVFVSGGAYGFDFIVQDTAEIYDPETQTSTLLENTMSTKRWSHSSETLHDGRVIIVGGRSGKNDTNGEILATAEIFDPVTGSFTPAADMNVPRRSHRSILLNDGRVFVAGGGDNVSTGYSYGLASAEIYDPNTDTFTPTSQDMHYGRQYQSMTLLQDGRVFIMGGCAGPSFLNVLNTAEIYDPVEDTFTLTPNMSVTRMGEPCVTLRDGRVLLTHSFNVQMIPVPPYMQMVLGNEAEIYDPNTDSYTQIPDTHMHHLIELPGIPLLDGTVLIPCGGNDLLQAFPVAHIFDPETETFPLTASLEYPRDDLAWVRLKDGRPIILGGLWMLYGTLTQVEIYTPSLESQVEGLKNAVSDLPETAFRNKNSKKQIIEKIEVVKSKIDKMGYQPALQITRNAILPVMDGCFGGNESNDKIVDCDAQDKVYYVAQLLINTLDKTITGNIPPVVSASAVPTSGEMPLAVQFTAVASDEDGEIIGYSWDFNDGSSSIEENPSHEFDCVGEFEVVITVIDDYGTSATDTIIITVTDGGIIYTSYRCKVQPAFNAYCTVCHSGSTPAANLDLTTYAGTMTPGVSGPCVIPYDPDNSLIIEYVEGYRHHPEEKGFMPLADSAIADLRAWITEGANDN